MTSDLKAVRWGVLSTAAIAEVVIRANRDSGVTSFVAVASRDEARARAFADANGIERSHGSYEALLADAGIDAVYVPLPMSMHAEWSIKALQAGKHVLCEKPFTTDAADARAVFDAAKANGRRCVEGFMWRLHPRTEAVRQLVANGAIGTLQSVRTALTVTVPEGDIRLSRVMGGGAHLDLGCYCVSGTRLFAGEPEEVFAHVVTGGAAGDEVDLRMTATMRMPGGVLAHLDVGLDSARRDELELVGSDGVIVVSDPWICADTTIEVRHAGTNADRGSRVEHVVAPTGGYDTTDPDVVYRVEFDRVSAAFATGDDLPFGAEDAVAQAAVLQALRESGESGLPVVPVIPRPS